jgi:hypothetical protein
MNYDVYICSQLLSMANEMCLDRELQLLHLLELSMPVWDFLICFQLGSVTEMGFTTKTHKQQFIFLVTPFMSNPSFS